MTAPARPSRGLPEQAILLIRQIDTLMAAWREGSDTPDPGFSAVVDQFLRLAPPPARESLSVDLFRFAFYCREHALALRERAPLRDRAKAAEAARDKANAEQTLRRNLLAALNGKLNTQSRSQSKVTPCQTRLTP